MIMQLAAIIILAAFYGCYFIKMFKQKRQGIKTDQIGKGKTGSAKLIELSMKAATILVPVAELSCIIFNISIMPTWARIFGICIGILGTVVFITSVITMKDSWRAGVPQTDKTELVTSGIYQISRNPAFLGFDLVYIGILLMFFNWLLFVLSIFAIIMFHLQIVYVEESFLAKSFGEEYLVYKKRVNRYLGKKLNLKRC